MVMAGDSCCSLKASDHKGARIVLNALPKADCLIADKGCDSTWFPEELLARGIEPCIPSSKSRKKPYLYAKALYRRRHKIENLFAKLKDWRRIAIRCDRCSHTFFSAICIAASVIFWLRLTSSKSFDKHLSEGSHFSRGILAGRPHDEDAGWRNRMTRHDRHQCTRTNMVRDKRFWQIGDPHSIQSGRYEGHCVISYEASLGTHRDNLVAIHELPLLGVPHNDLVIHNLVRCLGGTVSLDVGRTRNQLAKDRPDTSCDEVRVRKMPQPNCAIKTLSDEIYEAISIGRKDL